jgi:hypothetical protein
MAHKDVFVVLAFHAHEPWWDLPVHILETVDDAEMRRSIPPENWVRKRAEQGRDVYSQLIDVAKRLDAPMCLEATNELLMQIEEFAPQTYRALRDGFRDGALYPVYGGAHHAHCTLLTIDELADELRLNQEYLHDVLGAPQPRYRGAFPMEGSIDARKQEAFVRAGVQYVIFPNLSPRKARYEIEGGDDIPYRPFRLTSGVVGLPRHFPVSQDIWRPITKWKPKGLVLQGYVLGKYWVFDEEYRNHRYVQFPITREQAVAEYRGSLERALAEAPDGGLITYIQDLELMDYGEEALEIIEEAWRTASVPDVAAHIVTPDDYFERTGGIDQPLPSMRFFQVSWAPEIRPVLRCDGHYPPLDAGPIDGYDFDLEVFRRWPFIYWEWGRFHVDVLDSFLRAFGYPLVVPLTAAEWRERGYGYHKLDRGERLALHSRSMKQADNWGWQPDEDRQKRPYLHGHRIAEMLLEDLGDAARGEPVQVAFGPLEETSLAGLAQLPELFVGQRVAYLRRGIERLGERAGEHAGWAHHHLERAEERRREAGEAVGRARAANQRLASAVPPYAIEPLRELLEALRDHCRHVFLALDEIQRAWGSVADREGLVIEMYGYLYDLYPPLFPQLLRELAAPDELALVQDPPLS